MTNTQTKENDSFKNGGEVKYIDTLGGNEFYDYKNTSIMVTKEITDPRFPTPKQWWVNDIAYSSLEKAKKSIDKGTPNFGNGGNIYSDYFEDVRHDSITNTYTFLTKDDLEYYTDESGDITDGDGWSTPRLKDEKAIQEFFKSKKMKKKFSEGGEIAGQIKSLEAVINSDLIPDKIKDSAREKLASLKSSKNPKSTSKVKIDKSIIGKTFVSETGAENKIHDVVVDPHVEGYIGIRTTPEDKVGVFHNFTEAQFKKLVAGKSVNDCKIISTPSKSKKLDKKHDIEFIEILWAEGDQSKYDKFPKKYYSFADANHALKPILDKKEAGYNRVKFNIIWKDKDKSTYTGRLDISEKEDNPHTSPNLIGEHIIDFKNYYLKGEGSKGESEESKAEIENFLLNYRLSDKGFKKTAPKVLRKKKLTPPKVSRKKKSTPPVKKKRTVSPPTSKKASSKGKLLKSNGESWRVPELAKYIRQEEEKWHDAMKRASKIIKGELEMPKGKTVKRSKKSTGSSNMSIDRKRKALPAGQRISRTGKKYTENRANRSDKDGRRKLARGGEIYEGAEKLRRLVNAFGYRDESENAGKTASQLIKEFNAYSVGDINLDGYDENGKQFIKQDNRSNLDSIVTLRKVVEWMDSRDEYLNDNKSAIQLVKEYEKL